MSSVKFDFRLLVGKKLISIESNEHEIVFKFKRFLFRRTLVGANFERRGEPWEAKFEGKTIVGVENHPAISCPPDDHQESGLILDFGFGAIFLSDSGAIRELVPETNMGDVQ